jgi:hypothetical protein
MFCFYMSVVALPEHIFMLTILFVEMLAVTVLRHLSLEYMNFNNNILHDSVKELCSVNVLRV